MTITYVDAKTEFKMMATDDWGTSMTWWFTIADEIYFNRDFPVPKSWQFKPSPFGPSNDQEDYTTDIVQEMNDDDLLKFGLLIDRFARHLKFHGRSY